MKIPLCNTPHPSLPELRCQGLLLGDGMGCAFVVTKGWHKFEVTWVSPVADPGGYYVTDEDGNVVFAQSGEGHLCPVCGHIADQHHWDGCSASEGYDHINGFHECGCPLAPASAEAGESRGPEPETGR